MVMASPYRDSQTRWSNGKIFSLDPSSEEILLPFEGRRERERGGKMKFPTARKLRRAGNGKKVSNCSRTPANSIKICSARRSGRYIGKVAGFVHGFFFRQRAKTGGKTLLRTRQLRILGRSWLPSARASCQLQPPSPPDRNRTCNR